MFCRGDVDDDEVDSDAIVLVRNEQSQNDTRRNRDKLFLSNIFYEKNVDQRPTRKRQKCGSHLPFSTRIAQVFERMAQVEFE